MWTWNILSCFTAQPQKIRGKAYSYVRRLACIHRYLTTLAAAIIGADIVASRLVYFKSLLTGSTNKSIKRLLLVQNSLARVAYRIPKTTHISPTLSRLLWLPVKQRIDYKLVLLSWKVTRIGQPVYLTKLIIPRNVILSRCMSKQKWRWWTYRTSHQWSL